VVEWQPGPGQRYRDIWSVGGWARSDAAWS